MNSSAPHQRAVEPVLCQLGLASASDIARIERVCNRPPWPVELFEGEFKNPHSFSYGARADGRLVGFLVMHCVLDEAHILNFGVLPTYRRLGIGEKLLSFVLEECFNRLAHWATLEVRKSNLSAQALYKKLGFNEVALRKQYYTDDQEDGLVLKIHVPSFYERYRQ